MRKKRKKQFVFAFEIHDTWNVTPFLICLFLISAHNYFFNDYFGNIIINIVLIICVVQIVFGDWWTIKNSLSLIIYFVHVPHLDLWRSNAKLKRVKVDDDFVFVRRFYHGHPKEFHLKKKKIHLTDGKKNNYRIPVVLVKDSTFATKTHIDKLNNKQKIK